MKSWDQLQTGLKPQSVRIRVNLYLFETILQIDNEKANLTYNLELYEQIYNVLQYLIL